MAAVTGLLRDRGARWVLGGWAFFTVENVVLSEYRAEIKQFWGGRGGQSAYQAFYSSASALTLGTTYYAYYKFADTGVLYGPRPLWARLGALACRAGGLVFISQLLPPINYGAAGVALGLKELPKELSAEVRGALGCPFDFNAYKNRGEVFGITRVTRRPEMSGLGLVAMGGALLARTPTQVCFFGVGPVISFALLSLHIDHTQRPSGELSVEKEAQTSMTPFVALLDGRQSWTALVEETVPSNAWTAGACALLFGLRPSWMRLVK